MVHLMFIKVGKPKQKLTKTYYVDCVMTDVPKKKWQWLTFFLKITAILIIIGMFVIMTLRVRCVLICLFQIQGKLSGNVYFCPAKNVTTSQAISLAFPYHITFSVILLFMVLLLFPYVIFLCIRAGRSPGKPELKKIVMHCKCSVISKRIGNPEEKIAKLEKKT